MFLPLRVLVRLGGAILPILAAGCAAVGPEYREPEPASVPAAWHQQPESGLSADAPALESWWQRFGDPSLDSLITRATRQGLDVRAALARVREARALRGVAAADQLPTVDMLLSYERRGGSENTPLGGFVPESDLYSAGFDAAWEIDLWGRVRRSVEAADAELGAAVADARDAAVTVAAEVAFHYVRVRAFQKRLAIARTNVGLQEQTLALVRSRLAAGLVGERDVAQAMTNVATTRARLPELEVGLRNAENRLAVLLGLAPGSLAAELGTVGPVPVPPVEIAVGLPADLLRRRPDIRRAERLLAAETARIGVAEGDLYPRLSLLGNVGLDADHFTDLPEGRSLTFGIGPSLRWNLFGAGRLHQRVAAQDARAEQALVHWERAVLVALEEAENAMSAFVREQARRASLLAAATQARRSVELAQTQYSQGLSDFQPVLDSERTLADLEDQLAQSDAVVATNAVALYKALGGS